MLICLTSSLTLTKSNDQGFGFVKLAEFQALEEGSL